MKNNFKAMMPYIILNACIHAVIGAFIGSTVVNILNIRKIMSSDYKALKKFFRDMGGKATHIKLEDLDESEVPEDIISRY